MAFQGVGERNGAPENIAQQQKRLRLVNVRPILLGCYAELRLGRDVPKRKPDNSDRVSRKEKSTSSTREGIALGHNSAHHSLGSASARYTGRSNPRISTHVFASNMARGLHRGDLSDTHRDNDLLDSVTLRRL
jgi:hypothetical protein